MLPFRQLVLGCAVLLGGATDALALSNKEAAEACLTPMDTLEAQIAFLESVGLEARVTPNAIQQSASKFAIATVAENAPLNSAAFAWEDQQSKDSKLVLRTLSRGQTKITKFQFFTMNAEAGQLDLLLIRNTLPGVRTKVTCHVVGQEKSWPRSKLEMFKNMALEHNEHADGLNHFRMIYASTGKHAYTYLAISHYKPKFWKITNDGDHSIDNATIAVLSEISISHSSSTSKEVIHD